MKLHTLIDIFMNISIFIHFSLQSCHIYIKHRPWILAITFDWLTYLENGKEPAQEDTKTYIQKKYHSLTMLRLRCGGPTLDLFHFRASLTALI